MMLVWTSISSDFVGQLGLRPRSAVEKDILSTFYLAVTFEVKAAKMETGKAGAQLLGRLMRVLVGFCPSWKQG